MERYETANGEVYIIDGRIPQLMADPYADYKVRNGGDRVVFEGPYHDCFRFIRKKMEEARA